jgi:hypothetical protein
MKPVENNPRGPNCWQCQHFAVSWDPRMPYRCKRMGFKSAVLPSWEVLRVDGDFCRSFQLKNPTVKPAEVTPLGRKTSA